MLTVLDRYLIKEVLLTFAAVGTVLLSIIVGMGFVDLLDEVTQGELPADVIVPLLALASLESIILLAPAALLLALMLTLGRLYRDNEMAVLRACGVGDARLYRPLLVVCVPIVLGLSLLVLLVSPWSVRLADEIALEAESRADLSVISPGRFITAEDERHWVLFVEGIEREQGRIENVFIHSLDEDRSVIETAARGRQYIDPDTGVRWLELMDGHRYEGEPGQGDYRITSFARHATRLPQIGGAPAADNPDTRSTGALLASEHPADQAELQMRLSVPVSAVLLVLLAVPLSHTTPRQGRYAKLALAIMLYVLYANAILLAVSWLERGVLPPWLGVWWVHTLLLALIGGLFVRRYGLHWRFRIPRAA